MIMSAQLKHWARERDRDREEYERGGGGGQKTETQRLFSRIQCATLGGNYQICIPKIYSFHVNPIKSAAIL